MTTSGWLMRHTANSILAIDASPFGLSLDLVPAMRSLRALYPRALLVAAAPTGTCQLLTASGGVDEAIDLGVLKSTAGRHAGALKRFIALARRSRRYSFDLILDFSPRLETQIVSRLLVRGQTITPVVLPRALEILLMVGDARPPAERSHSDDYLRVLSRVGVEGFNSDLCIKPSSEDNSRFERLLSQSGSRGGELIVLLYASDPGSAHGWPIEAFGEIGSRLANNFGARIVVADEPSDDMFSDRVTAYLPRGTLKLAAPQALELVAALARSSLVVTDDHSIARLAQGLGTRVIEVTDTQSGATTGSGSHRVIRAGNRARISPDEVFEAASVMIQDSRSASLFDLP